MQKTNAVRLVEQAGIPCLVREYPVDDGKIDGISIARKLQIPQESCFKTLVTENPAHENFVFVIPVAEELDLKKAAKVSGNKSISMIPMKKLIPLTGYEHGGCSPVGMKKQFPTFIAEEAILYPEIAVSGGKVGLNIALDPEKLAALIGAVFADLVVQSK